MAAPGCQAKEGLLVLVWGTNTKRPLLRGRGARADQAFVTQGDRRMTRVTGGNPGGRRSKSFNRATKLSAALTVFDCYAFFRFGSA